VLTSLPRARIRGQGVASVAVGKKDEYVASAGSSSRYGSATQGRPGT